MAAKKGKQDKLREYALLYLREQCRDFVDIQDEIEGLLVSPKRHSDLCKDIPGRRAFLDAIAQDHIERIEEIIHNLKGVKS